MKVITLLALLPMAVSAAPVMDQCYWPQTTAYEATVGVTPLGSNYQVFQSFTVGISGALLKLDVAMSKWGAPTEGVLFEIVDGDYPTGPALASVLLPPDAIPQTWAGYTGALPVLTVNLKAAHLNVKAGDFLGFRISSAQHLDGNTTAYWAYLGDGGYTGGGGNHIADGVVQPNQYIAWDFYLRSYINTGKKIVSTCSP